MSLFWLLLVIVGLAAGTFGSLIGLGGGIIIVPSLMFIGQIFPEFSNITPSIAVGTSLLLVVLTSLSSTLFFAKQKRVDFQSGWLYFLGSGPGSILGAYFTRYFKADSFFIAFGLFMIVISIILTIKDRLPVKRIHWDVSRTFVDGFGQKYEYGYHRVMVVTISFFIGMLSSLFGIGGGSLLVPVMIILFAYPPHVATATSMFIILLSSSVGSITHLIQGNVHFLAALLLAPGAWLGGKAGAWISSKLSGKGLLIVFRVSLILMAIRMILNGFHII
ncbi:sulfite exporter TauE/SafE family protein [Thermoflavimicrobium daqui]|uniref:sulfite exporter TauE/SafE family protein n=1 Tax=Thermoflavimicrobium daqui TaxID=2137476 RepID=UPI00269DA504